MADLDPAEDPRPAATRPPDRRRRAAAAGDSRRGPALGALVAGGTIGPLALRLLTGQATDPVVVLPWTGLGLVAVAFLAAVAVVTPVDWALCRHRTMGEVLRVGDA
ncbi:hypothetical protein AB0B66_38510 [Catellatospora sp. NPDC049111]|uniref:hypothetical protein n=1 Tax=Catellatospora sp. NPDC049111 TaxID=3155271 RepID=UPI00340EA7B5